MIFSNILNLVVICDKNASYSEETTIPISDYQERVFSLLLTAYVVHIKYHVNTREIIQKFYFVSKTIYEHFNGNKDKLAALKSVFLESYKFILDHILLALEYERENPYNPYLGIKKTMWKNRKMHDILPFDNLTEISILEKELVFFLRQL